MSEVEQFEVLRTAIERADKLEQSGKDFVVVRSGNYGTLGI